jgi:PAS domain S-box-containing protein
LAQVGYFQRVNPAWERTLGYLTAELLDWPFLDFVHSRDFMKLTAMIRETVTKTGRELNHLVGSLLDRIEEHPLPSLDTRP